MTIPYFSNCSHEPSGWCLECISDLGREILDKDEYVSNLEKWLLHLANYVNDEYTCITEDLSRDWFGNLDFYNWYDEQEDRERKRKDEIRENALKKLTDDEKEILGL